MTKPTGWYTVTLHDIKIGDVSIDVDPSAVRLHCVNLFYIVHIGVYVVMLVGARALLSPSTTTNDPHTKQFNTGQGTIVDSGTTDTYLPRSIQAAFTSAFKKVGAYMCVWVVN